MLINVTKTVKTGMSHHVSPGFLELMMVKVNVTTCLFAFSRHYKYERYCLRNRWHIEDNPHRVYSILKKCSIIKKNNMLILG